MSKKTCILVLGMHRCGTSAMSGILNLLQIRNNAWRDYRPDNVKGSYEHVELVRANDRILKHMKSAWDDPDPFRENWFEADDIKPYAEEIAGIISRDFQDADLFSIKDPRISILLPLYLNVFRQLDIQLRFIVMERKDEEICLSLKKRNRFSVKKAQALCRKYKTTIHDHIEGYPGLPIRFDDLVGDPVSTAERIIAFFDLQIVFDEGLRKTVAAFIDPSLKHHNLDTLKLMEKVSLLRFEEGKDA